MLGGGIEEFLHCGITQELLFIIIKVTTWLHEPEQAEYEEHLSSCPVQLEPHKCVSEHNLLAKFYHCDK